MLFRNFIQRMAWSHNPFGYYYGLLLLFKLTKHARSISDDFGFRRRLHQRGSSVERYQRQCRSISRSIAVRQRREYN